MKRLFKRLFRKRSAAVVVLYSNGQARSFSSFEAALRFMFSR